MPTKLSHLIRAGAIVHTVDGGVYRCTSKFASEGKFHLSDLQGKSVQTPINFYPISKSMARFAAWIRLAFNSDFDLYVKEYIKAAGLPVDPAMNWSKFFAAKIAPKLVSKDPEVQDEAIHHIIIKALVERNVLSNFKEAIKRFPERIRELPVERQITTFLMQTFNWRVEEANRYIRDIIFQDNTRSMWEYDEDSSEGEGHNILDTIDDRTQDKGFELAESDVDVANFREKFEKYLKDKFREDTVDKYLDLFDLLYAHLREGDLPHGGDIYEEWKENETGKAKSYSWFKVLFANLPKLIDTFIAKHLNTDKVSPFIDIMRQIGQERKKRQLELQPVMGGLKLADYSGYDEFPINHDISESDSSDSENSGSGFSGLPSSLEDGGTEGAGSLMEGAGGLVEDLAPLAMAASKSIAATQWELSKCKGCGSQNVTECPGCHEKYCHDCLGTHHANHPSHDRIASTKNAHGMKLLDTYKGWTIEENPAGLIVVGRPDSGGFPFIAKDVEHAKQVIDQREDAALKQATKKAK